MRRRRREKKVDGGVTGQSTTLTPSKFDGARLAPEVLCCNETTGTLKTRDWKTQDHIARVEIAGLENICSLACR